MLRTPGLVALITVPADQAARAGLAQTGIGVFGGLLSTLSTYHLLFGQFH